MTTAEEHDLFMARALDEAEKALLRGDFPVGCVIVAQDRIVASGSRRNSQGRNSNELDHAEIVTLRKLFAQPERPAPGEITAYSTMEPCLMCFSTMLLAGVKKIVYGYEDVMGGGCGVELKRLAPLYRSMEPEIISGIRRDECLALFQRFFRDPGNRYWQESELARYTLEQKQPHE